MNEHLTNQIVAAIIQDGTVKMPAEELTPIVGAAVALLTTEYTFPGIVQPKTSPGSILQPTLVVAVAGGTYPGYSNNSVNEGDIVFFTTTDGGSWAKVVAYSHSDNLEERMDAAEADIATLQENVDELMLGSHDHMAAAWSEGQADPEAVTRMGDMGIVNFDFFLMDNTRNTGKHSAPVGRLKRNNILRLDTGEWSPAVGITAAMLAECMDNDLYLDGELYAAAGAFDPAAFYADHCSWVKDEDNVWRLHMDTLVKESADGEEVTHYLMPWETAETKYSIYLGLDHPLYYLQNAKGTSGKVWNFISTTRKSWDGRTTLELKPSAFTPSPVAMITENNVRKSRCFFFAYNGEAVSYGNGAAGSNGMMTLFRNTGRTFPATSIMTQITSMQYARNNNADPTKPYPYAEGGWWLLNAFLTFLEIKYGTRAIHATDKFTSGISANDNCGNEAQFLANGGVRSRAAGTTAWEYKKWSENPVALRINAQGAAAGVNWSNFVNGYHAKEACMESQLAASFAVEAGIAEGETFEMYGATYSWASVDGAANLEHGHMNAIIRSIRSQTVSAYNAAGEATDFEVECCLRMPLYEGANITGDIYTYFGGGLEMISTAVSGVSGHSGDTVEFFGEANQEDWVTDTQVQHNDGTPFVAEGAYERLGEAKNVGDGYSLKDAEMLPWKIAAGGSITTYMSHYCYDRNAWASAAGQRARLAVRFRGTATIPYCSPRYLFAAFAASLSTAHYGGSAQVLLPEGAAPPQAE